ncbi:hypothetical protein [Nonomuraea sp. NPDC002799]
MPPLLACHGDPVGVHGRRGATGPFPAAYRHSLGPFAARHRHSLGPFAAAHRHSLTGRVRPRDGSRTTGLLPSR